MYIIVENIKLILAILYFNAENIKEGMTDSQKEALDDSIGFMESRLELMEVVNLLISKRVLTKNDKTVIRKEKEKISRLRCFVSIINDKPGDVFEIILDALEESGCNDELIELLMNKEETLKAKQNSRGKGMSVSEEKTLTESMDLLQAQVSTIELVNSLINKGILDEADQSVIRKERGKRRKFTKVVSVLKDKSENAFERIVDALEDIDGSDDLVELLVDKEHMIKDNDLTGTDMSKSEQKALDESMETLHAELEPMSLADNNFTGTAMSMSEKKALDESMETLHAELEPMSLAGYFLDKDILTKGDLTAIRKEKGRQRRVDIFVSLLKSKPGNAYHHLLNATEDSGCNDNVFKVLKEKERSTPDALSTNNSRHHTDLTDTSFKTGTMTSFQKGALDDIMAQMELQLEPMSILEYLIVNDIFTQDDRTVIKKMKEKRARVQCFISILSGKPGNTFIHMVNALEDSGCNDELRELLLDREKTLRSESFKNGEYNMDDTITSSQRGALDDIMVQMELQLEPMSVVGYLMDKGILTYQDRLAIKIEKEKRKRVQCFITILKSKTGNVFQHLLDALEDSGCNDELHGLLRKTDEMLRKRTESDVQIHVPTGHPSENVQPSTYDDNKPPLPRQRKQMLKELLQVAHLTRVFDSKVSLVDAVVVKELSRHAADDQLVEMFISTLTCYDHRAQLLTLQPTSENSEMVRDPDSDVGEDWLSETSNLAVKDEDSYSSRDILYVILNCLDPFLLQEILMKLSACQIAVPVLMPQCHGSGVTFTLWGLRKINKSWYNSNNKIQTERVATFQLPSIAALRFGDITLSKSNILNKLLGPAQGNDDHAFFVSIEQDPYRVLISKGTLEAIWFTPKRNEKLLQSAFTLFNLRGDAIDYNTQAKFAIQNSLATIVFIMDDCKELYKDRINTIKEETHVILICCPKVNTEHRRQAAVNKKSITIINTSTYTALEISNMVSNVLSKLLSQHSVTACSLQDKITHSPEFLIDIDEFNSDCQEAKNTAVEIRDMVKKDTKDNLFPIQKLWKQWALLDKEKITGSNSQNIEKQISKRKQNKSKIRRMQAETRTSVPVTLFYKSTAVENSTKRNYFIQWLQILLNDLSLEKLKPLSQDLNRVSLQKRELMTKINKLEASINEETNSDDRNNKGESENQLKKKQREELEKNRIQIEADEKGILAKYEDNSIGLEHFIREIGQVAESHIYINIPTSKCNMNMESLPKLAAQLLLEGYPIELFDGDANHVPFEWVKSVLQNVSNIIGCKSVYIISVLGIQSSGKSTLLNSMFGVRFAVSAGRCTRGAFLQLLPVEEKFKQDLGYNYIAIVDTEGLRAPEKMSLAYSPAQDNELATFALCISDLTLINIGGQTITEDMANVLQIAAHAFIRMKEVDLRAECRIVQQFVADLTAEDKNETAMRAIMLKLDEAICDAAKDEGKQNIYKQFSDIFTVQNLTPGTENVQYLPNLWRGLMSAPDSQYSVRVQQLKLSILKSIKTQGRQPSTIADFTYRIKDVWKAIKEENFVFSFQNSKEVSLYGECMATYKAWTDPIRLNIMKMQFAAMHEIENESKAEIQGVKSDRKAAILTQLGSDCAAVETKVEALLKEEKYLQVAKHKLYFFGDIQSFKTQLSSSVTTELDKHADIHIQAKQKDPEIKVLISELNKTMENFAEPLREKIKNQAYHKNSEEIIDRIINDEFTKHWNTWMKEKRNKYPIKSFEVIKKSKEMYIQDAINVNVQAGQLAKPMRELLCHGKSLSQYSSLSQSITDTSNLESIALTFSNYDKTINNSFEELLTYIAKLGACFENFTMNALQVLDQFEKCIHNCKSQEDLSNIIMFASSVFICNTHRMHIEEETTTILKDINKMSKIASHANMVSPRDIPKELMINTLGILSETCIVVDVAELKRQLVKISDPLIVNSDDDDEFSPNVYTGGILSKLYRIIAGPDTALNKVFKQINFEFEQIYKKGNSICSKECFKLVAHILLEKAVGRNIIKLESQDIQYIIAAFKYSKTLLKNYFLVALKDYITKSTYTIQFTQPLKYPTIDSKLQFLLQIMKEKSFTYLPFLMSHLSVPNLDKISNLPREVRLIQTVDVEYLKLLPLLPTNESYTVHSIINDKKKLVLERSKSNPSITDSLITTIVAEIIKDEKYQTFSNELKVASIVHIGAWCLPILSLKQFHYEYSKNVANALEHERGMLLTRFRSLCSIHRDKVNAAALVDIMENAIKTGIYYKIAPLLIEEIRDKNVAFRQKALFIGTVLKDLCQNNDYQGLMQFVKNFEDFSKSWILEFVRKECEASNLLFLKTISDQCVCILIYRACSSLDGITMVSTNLNLHKWVDIFMKQFREETGLTCNQSEITQFKQYFKVNDLSIFAKECKDEIMKRESNIKLFFKEELPNYNVDKNATKTWLLRMPKPVVNVALFDFFGGCKKQCPFCGVVCDHSLAIHKKHQSMAHFPDGISGMHWMNSKQLSIVICTSGVLSSARYKTPSHVTDPEYRLFSEYETDYPEWFIRPDPNDNTSDFWKYMFAEFNTRIAKEYELEDADVPSEWMELNKEEALVSVADIYKLNTI